MFTHGHARAGSRCGNRAARAKLAVMDCPARPMHWSWLEPLALSKNAAGQTNAAHVRASISSVNLSLPKQIVRIHLVDLRKCRINVAGRSSCPDRISLPNGWFYLKALHGGAPNRYDSIAIYVASALGFQQESVSLTTGVRTDRRFSSRSGARSSRTAGTGTQTNALRPKYPRDGGRGDPAEVLADPLQ